MNKAELVSQIASEAGLTNKDTALFLDTFVSVVQKTLKKGDSVTLIGFGQFLVAERSARSARDFKTGNMINVPATKVVKFKAGKGLKNAVNS